MPKESIQDFVKKLQEDNAEKIKELQRFQEIIDKLKTESEDVIYRYECEMRLGS